MIFRLRSSPPQSHVSRPPTIAAWCGKSIRAPGPNTLIIWPRRICPLGRAITPGPPRDRSHSRSVRSAGGFHIAERAVRLELRRSAFDPLQIRIERITQQVRSGAVVVLLVAKRGSRVLLLFRNLSPIVEQVFHFAPNAVPTLLHLFAVQRGVLLDSATENIHDGRKA